MTPFAPFRGLLLGAAVLALALPAAADASREAPAADDTYEAAAAAYRRGDYGPAADGFRALIDRSPDWAAGRVLLGQCEYMLGRPDDAERWFEQAVASDDATDLFAAFLQSGQLLKRAGRFDEAARPLARALERAPEPERRSTMLDLGYTYYRAGDYDGAAEVLEEIDRQYGLEPEHAFYLALACRRRRDYRCAIDVMSRVARTGLASDSERDVLGNLARWSYYWALVAENEDRRPLLLEQAVEHTRAWFVSPLRTQESVELYGRALLATGRTGEVVAEIGRFAEENPRRCPAPVLVAQALNVLGRAEEAERWSRRALECDPESAPALQQLAAALAGRLRPEHSDLDEVRRDQALARDAVEAIERALRIDPGLGSRAETLRDQLAETRAALSRLEQDLIKAARDVERANRERCLAIIWQMRDETRELPAEDLEFYREHDCAQYRNPPRPQGVD